MNANWKEIDFELERKSKLIADLQANLAHKDRMLEELGNINGKAVAEVEKLRKALESILAVDDWESTAKVAAMWEIAERALA